MFTYTEYLLLCRVWTFYSSICRLCYFKIMLYLSYIDMLHTVESFLIKGANVFGLSKICWLWGCYFVGNWLVALWYISLLYIRGHVNSWLRVTHKILQHCSPINNDDSTVACGNVLSNTVHDDIQTSNQHVKIMKIY